MRDMTAAVEAETLKSAVTPFLLVQMDFDSDTLRLWSGVGDLLWNGETWLGAGDLGTVSPVRETRDTRAEGLNFSLSGVPNEKLALALLEPYQGRPAALMLGLLDDNGAVIADPVQIFRGRMDVMEIAEGAETSKITVAVESNLIDLRRSREWRYTHEDQQIDYPGDLGLEFVAGLQNKEIKWGP